jgi:hypothetical protein
MTQPRITHRSVDVDGYPTRCCRCGQPIVKKHHDSQHHHDHATHTSTSWHTTCTTAAPAAPSSSGSSPGRPVAVTAGAVRRNINHPTRTGVPMTTIEPEPAPQPDPEPAPDPDPDPEDEK